MVVLSDSFNRADTTAGLGTADTGQSWTSSYGPLGIASSRAYAPNAGGGRAYIDSGLSDMDLSINLNVHDTGSEEWVHFRAVDGNSFWRFGYAATGNYVLQKYTGSGSPASTSTSTAPTSGDTIRVVTNVGNITCYVNGAVVAGVIDTYNSTQTKVGVEIFKATSSSSRFDDLVVSDADSLLSSAETFGLHVVTSTRIDAYLNGVNLGSFDVPDDSATGDQIVLAHFNEVGNSPSQRVYVSRIELWTAPGGTLIASDDFNNLSGWTSGVGGSAWTISSGRATCSAPNLGAPAPSYGVSVIHQADSGAGYVEIQGVRFGHYYPTQDAWVMLILRDPGDDEPFSGNNGYRLLLRQPGSTLPGQIPGEPRVKAPDGTLLTAAGWGVGMVRIA